MTRETALLVGGCMLALIVWLLFAHWQWGVSVMLFLILINQGNRGKR